MKDFFELINKRQSVRSYDSTKTVEKEKIDYLNNFFPNQIKGLDYDIEQCDINEFIRENNVKKVIMQVNYENAKNAFEMASKIKEQNENSFCSPACL